jgi:type IV pilus biogenesis protein CpaD/CtpE
MRRNLSVLLGLAVVLLAGCATADQKVPEIAADFCNCFSEIQSKMSAKTKDLILKAANSATPQATLSTELLSLPEEERFEISKELMVMADLGDETSSVGRCMKDVEKKYGDARTFNKKEFAEKVIKELESKQGCDFTAMLMKIGLKEKKMD